MINTNGEPIGKFLADRDLKPVFTMRKVNPDSRNPSTDGTGHARAGEFDLGPVYECIDCKTVAFEWFDEWGGVPTHAGIVHNGEHSLSGRVCLPCWEIRFRAICAARR